LGIVASFASAMLSYLARISLKTQGRAALSGIDLSDLCLGKLTIFILYLTSARRVLA
jgi:hypothetical protein